MSDRHQAHLASIPGSDPAEPLGDRVLAITTVTHPDHPVPVSLRIYGPDDWDGEVQFTEDSAVVDGVVVPVEDIRRGWTRVA